MVQLARVIYSNIYREDDRPECESTPYPNGIMLTPLQDRRGNRVLVAIACMNICVYLIAKGFYIWKNKTREREWNAMTEDVRSNYLTQDLSRALLTAIVRNVFTTSTPPRIPEVARRTSASCTRTRCVALFDRVARIRGLASEDNHGQRLVRVWLDRTPAERVTA